MRPISLSPPAWVTQRSGLTVFLSLVLTVAALSRLVDFETREAQLLLDPSVNSMLPSENDDSRFYERVRETFGSDERIVVALSDREVFDRDALASIVEISDRISRVEGVKQVRSLESLVSAPTGEDGAWVVSLPESEAELAALREAALANPLLVGSLVSPDARTTALVVEFDDISEQEIFDRGLDLEIERIAEAERGSASLAITGGARIKAEMARLLLDDLSLIVPVAILVIALVAFLSFRTLRAVVVLLTTVAISTVWLLAIIALTAGSLNQVTVAVPPILIVVGFAYAVHVLSAYYAVLREGLRGGEAARAAVQHVALPVILTGVTTCAGFASLATSKLEAIQQFGLFAALGVLLTTIASLTFAPALLALLPGPDKVPAQSARHSFDRLVEVVARFDVTRRHGILWAFAGIALISGIGMTRTQVNTDLVKNFKPDNQVRRDFETVNAELGGANSLSVVLESPYLRAFSTAAGLRMIEELQTWLESRPEIGATTSILDHLEAAYRAGGREGGVVDAIEAGAPADEWLAAIPSEALASVVDGRLQMANIRVRTSAVDSADVVQLVEEIEAHFEELPKTVIPTVTGNAVLMSRTIDEIALGQALSLSTAFLIIFAILVLLFASFRVGFIALIPNALPVLFYFGVLGWAGIDLNTTTGLVAALVLGIAVDDTIHYLAQFNVAAKGEADTRKGVVTALHSVIRPVSYTTAALCLGFSTLMLSELRNQVEFGALAAGTLAFAWLVDITLTPALAARMRVVTLWDLLTLDIGPEPQRAIPLFAGLRETQARVVALLARTQHIHKGHHLMVRGSPGEGMYILIDGELEISVPRADDSVSLQIARRGDSLGEGALFHGRRIVDATALSDARLLLINEDELSQLRERYPRIATLVYRNMSRILAVQLAQATGIVSSPPEVVADEPASETQSEA